MRKMKMLAWIVASAMSISAIGALSVTGFADGGGGISAADGTKNVTSAVTTEQALKELMSSAVSGTTIPLGANITLTESLTIPEGVTIDAAGYDIILPTLADPAVTVTTASGDDSLNKVLKAEAVEIDPSDVFDVLTAYTDDGTNRVYAASNVIGSNEGDNGIYNIYMGGRAVVINKQSEDSLDTDLKLTYTENGIQYNALYNTAKHTNGKDLPARIFGGLEKPTEYAANYQEMLGLSIENVNEYKLTLESGKIESLRGSNKNKAGATVDKITIEVTGGEADIVASGWYYLESVKEYNVNISGGTVGSVYGNGQTSYTAADNMNDPNFVPTVDTANINISGGSVGFVYGGGRAVTQSANSINHSMITKQANINITSGSIGYVNGGGFSGPEANWGGTSGMDNVTVDNAVITVSGGSVTQLFAGGYNGQWKYTYKVNAKGELVFSNYNGTDETSVSVRNIVNNAVVNIKNDANVINLYLGGRSYSNTKTAELNMEGGVVEKLSMSGNYGYSENSSAEIVGGTVNKLELVTRNYVGNIDINVTGGDINEFYAGTGGAYKNGNLNETAYNISTIAIMGDVNINFADGYTPKESYLTTGLERASSVTSNIPLEVKTINLVEGGYTGDFTQSGDFAGVNEFAEWNTTIVLASENESFKPAATTDTLKIQDSNGASLTADADGIYKLTEVTTVSTGDAILGEGTDESVATGFITTVTTNGIIDSIQWGITSASQTGTTEIFVTPNLTGEVKLGIIISGLYDDAAKAAATVTTASGTFTESN